MFGAKVGLGPVRWREFESGREWNCGTGTGRVKRCSTPREVEHGQSVLGSSLQELSYPDAQQPEADRRSSRCGCRNAGLDPGPGRTGVCKGRIETERTPLPCGPSRQGRGHLLRHEGARTLPVDGESRQPGGRDVGPGRKPGNLRLPRQDSLARLDQEPADHALELRQGRHPRTGRREAVLQKEQRPAEPIRRVRAGFVLGEAAGADRSEHSIPGRVHRPGGLGAFDGRQVSRLPAVRGRFRLGDDPRPGRRDGKGT